MHAEEGTCAAKNPTPARIQGGVDFAGKVSKSVGASASCLPPAIAKTVVSLTFANIIFG